MNYSRKQFIAKAASVFGAILIAPGMILAKTRSVSSNVDPTSVSAAITIAQFALSSAKLFQGSSVSGISEIQMRMLANISKQLSVLQETITIILQSLEEVKTLINELPQAVVTELNTANISGTIHSFDELMRVYANYGKNRKAFKLEHGPEVVKLLETVRQSRNVLINYDNYLNIPVVSAAVYIEYSCMRLMDEKEERIVEAMRTYRDYFKASGAKLSDSLLQIRKERASLQSDMLKTNPLESYIPSRAGYGFHYLIQGLYSYESTVGTSAADSLTIEELKVLGLIQEMEIPLDVKPSIKLYLFDGSNRANWLYVVGDDHESKALLQSPRNIVSLPTLSAEKARIEQSAKDLANSINLKTFQIYSAVSCLYSGNRSLNFCQQF